MRYNGRLQKKKIKGISVKKIEFSFSCAYRRYSIRYTVFY